MSWVRERTTIDALNSIPPESPPSKGLCSVLTIPCKKKVFKSSTVTNRGFFQMPEKEWNTFDSSSLEGVEDCKGYLFLGLLVEKMTIQLNRWPASRQIHLYRKTKLVSHTSNSNYYRKDSTSLSRINLMDRTFLFWKLELPPTGDFGLLLWLLPLISSSLLFD